MRDSPRPYRIAQRSRDMILPHDIVKGLRTKSAC
jgi:hypothetical protein